EVGRGARGLARAHALPLEDEDRAPAPEEPIGHGEPRDARPHDADVGAERRGHRLEREQIVARPDRYVPGTLRCAHPRPPDPYGWVGALGGQWAAWLSWPSSRGCPRRAPRPSPTCGCSPRPT